MQLAGDLRTFERAYRAEGPYVAAVLGRLAVPPDTVGDAVQDVFIAAYQRWSDFDSSRPVRPWLTGFARHIAFRYRRSAARRSRKRAALALVSREHARAPSHRVLARDFLQRFLETQEPGHQRAFMMAELEGRGAAEIAGALEISTEAVYGRVRATRRRLKEALLRDADRPSRKAAAAVPPWVVLLPRLGQSVAANTMLGVATAGAIKTFVAIVVVGVAGLSVAASSSGQTDLAASNAPRAASEVVHSSEVGAVEDTSVSSRPNPPAAKSPPKPSVIAQAQTASALASKRTAARSMGQAAAELPHTLSQETELLRSARAALADSDPKSALVHLAKHATMFPLGQLADARRRARIRALCDLGRQAQARGEARQMVRAHPGDPLAVQATSICKRGADPDRGPAGQ
ncbi:MAG: sigma-70 family RNA polymerase sigma factor [Nannocystaceae bacterium]|nr:sigma-70 family RNA polymerase sigma factor [Nannocystaceae bacterium]